MRCYALRILLAAFCLAGVGLGASADNGDPVFRPDVDFSLWAINGQPLAYVVTSPTDGDVLDRGLRFHVVTFEFSSNAGERVLCRDAAGQILGQAFRESCRNQRPQEYSCFQMALDTRDLPNGAHRLSFELHDHASPQGDAGELLGRIDLVIHVLNARIELERDGADAIRIRIKAGVRSPADVQGFRYALFAGSRPIPSLLLPDYLHGPGPRERAPLGPFPVRVLPPDTMEQPAASWPNGNRYLRFDMSRSALCASVGAARNADPVYLTAVIHDGQRWRWTAPIEIRPPASGQGMGPPSTPMAGGP